MSTALHQPAALFAIYPCVLIFGHSLYADSLAQVPLFVKHFFKNYSKEQAVSVSLDEGLGDGRSIYFALRASMEEHLGA
jgi:hypothetical protein